MVVADKKRRAPVKRVKLVRSIVSLGIGIFALEAAAFAECTVPNAISNGQVADASKVMDNFTAIAGCVDAGVKPTGTPQAGEIAVFSSSQTVTGGNLSGDVTTSGGTATTLSASGVTPGYYVIPASRSMPRAGCPLRSMALAETEAGAAGPNWC